MATVTYLNESEKVSVPGWVVDIDSFRRWTDCEDFPQEGRIWWLCGEVWADMSKEQIFTHLAVKNEVTYVLTGLVKAGKLGLILPDGLLLSNFAADISGNPDATFLLDETLRSDRLHIRKDGFRNYKRASMPRDRDMTRVCTNKNE